MTTRFHSVRRFLHHEAAGGICLMASAILALICANTPVIRDIYGQLSHPWVGIVVNDGLMAIFFLLVGLELKREALGVGLDKSRIIQPLLAAVGGMLVPVLIYLGATGFAPAYRAGWAIPAATDIAFALGVAILPGGRLPTAIKTLLLAIAILDDLGAIVIIALFYGHAMLATWLGIALCGCVGLLVLNRRQVRSISLYMLCGAVVWLGLLKGGLHPTLAGVITAFALPHKNNTAGSSVLVHCEHALHPFVAFGVLPIFAFVNAGLSFHTMAFDTVLHPVALGVFAGLLVGKPLGILGGLWLGHVTRVAPLLRISGSVRPYTVMSLLCGIGFTMSLFINDLAFAEASMRDPAKLGILAASVLAAVLGRLMMGRLMKS